MLFDDLALPTQQKYQSPECESHQPKERFGYQAERKSYEEPDMPHCREDCALMFQFIHSR